jgi:hypothetical protein
MPGAGSVFFKQQGVGGKSGTPAFFGLVKESAQSRPQLIETLLERRQLLKQRKGVFACD